MGLNQQPMCAWSHESGEVTLTVCMNIHRAVHHNNSTRHRTAFTVPHDTAQPSVNLPRLNRRKTWIKMCLSCLKLWLLDDKASSNVCTSSSMRKRGSLFSIHSEKSWRSDGNTQQPMYTVISGQMPTSKLKSWRSNIRIFLKTYNFEYAENEMKFESYIWKRIYRRYKKKVQYLLFRWSDMTPIPSCCQCEHWNPHL